MPILARRGTDVICWKGPALSPLVCWQRAAARESDAVSAHPTKTAAAVRRQASARIAAQLSVARLAISANYVPRLASCRTHVLPSGSLKSANEP